MYLNKEKIQELFLEFCTQFGGNKIMTLDGFTRAIDSITDKSNMLEDSDYISLPELCNELRIVAHVSCLIEMNVIGEVTDKELLESLKECSSGFTESIKKLSRKEN